MLARVRNRAYVMAMSPATPEPKTCAVCGRTMTWRPRWAKVWNTIKTCSDACRKNRLGEVDHTLERTILSLLQSRKAGATICPSEASRAVFGQEAGLLPASMQRTRYAAYRLAAAQAIEVTQKGRVVDPSTAKGPIRLRARASPP